MRLLALLAALAIAPAALARTLPVGPKKEFRTIAKAAEKAKPGDLILIEPGIYNEAIIWRGGSLDGAPITVRGAGVGKTIVDGTGLVITGRGPQPRALFQVEGDNFIFEDLEFRNARNHQNAAAFRLLRARKTVVRRCLIHWCDMGFQSTDNDLLLVEFSEIAFNGTPEYNGYSHNFYIAGNRSTIRHNYIHDSTNGQTFKTRGRYTELLYNYIADAHDRIEQGDTTKEIGIQEGKEASKPNAHALLVGNIIIKRGNGGSFLDFGPEGKEPGRNGTLFLINNTIIRETFVPRWMLRMGHSMERAVLYNNVFYGFQEFVRGEGATNITGSNNWFPEGAEIPAGLKYTFTGKDPGFVNLQGRDYRLAPGSSCIDQGAEGVHALDADGRDYVVEASKQFATPIGVVDRVKIGRIDIGAIEHDPQTFARASSTLAGRLLDAGGQPVAGVPVMLEGPVSLITRSAADGAYLFKLLPPGAYKAAAWPFRFGGWQPEKAALELAGAATADFRAPPLHTIRGVVRMGSGNPVRDVAVYLEGDGSAWSFAEEDGKFAFPPLPAGRRYFVRPVKSVIEFSQPIIEIPSLNADLNLEIKGQGRFIIAGSIREADNTPVAGVAVEISGVKMPAARSNVRGNFSFTKLPEGGTYTVTPKRGGYHFEPPSITYEKLDWNKRETHFRAVRE